MTRNDLTDNDLKRLQQTQLEILKVIDSFCKKHQIPYSLYAGTLLGAVRHKGFIPWDDDLDVCMRRRDYNRFIKAWLKDGPEGYIIQNKELEPRYVQSFTKIRKDHTTFLQEEMERGKWHTGIFVDVFPIDRIPRGRLAQKIYYYNALLYQLYTREFVPPRAGRLTQIMTSFLLKAVRGKARKKMRRFFFHQLIIYNKFPSLPLIAVETQGTLKQILPGNIMDKFVELPFGDGVFPCMREYDAYLTLKYGDYMKLPPAEQRSWQHHPIVLDFEHNLEEI